MNTTTKLLIRLLIALILLTRLNQAAAQVAFAPAVNYPEGGPETVITADVNGDGKVDLISANSSTHSLSVLTNNGVGGFVAASSITPVAFAFGRHIPVLAADVNNDGKLDLVCVTQDNLLSTFTNNGLGGFVLASSPVLSPGQPVALVAVDVNGDGKLDMIIAEWSYPRLLAFTNDGVGGFKGTQELPCGQNPGTVVAADVNGDGKMDLVVPNYGYGTLSLLINNGQGGFPIASLVAVEGFPSAVITVDVNGDGKADLITAQSDGTLTALTNNGSGGFMLAGALGLGNGVVPMSVAAADLNGDGRADLITANFLSNSLSVFMSVPTLALKLSASTKSVSWPSSWTNWTLRQSSDLKPTNWTACVGIFNDGTNNSLAISSSGASQFFRSSHP